MFFPKLLVAAMLFAAAAALAQTSPDSAAESALHHQKAEQYLREKRPDLAIPELAAIVRLNPQDVEAQANLGVLLYFRGDYAHATPALRAALNLRPGLTKIQALLGMSEDRSGDPEAARKDLMAVFPQLQEEKVQMEAGLELIHIDKQAGQLDQAAGIVAKLEQIEPANPELLYIAYRLYSDLAGQAMLSLSLAAPDSAQMHAVMAHEDARQGDDAPAIAQYRQALALNPKLPGADVELAELLRHASDVSQQAEAVSIFRAALKTNPFDEQSAVQLGDLSLEKGNLPQAKSNFEQALQLEPSDPDANFGLAKTLIAMNDSAHALPLLEKAVQLDPTNASAHFRLATLYRQQGRTADARQQLATFQKLRQLKDKMAALYKQMRVQPQAQSQEKEEK
jgi:tetratricopeptide (TPR) repeat protein